MPLFLLSIALIAPDLDVPKNWLMYGAVLVVTGLYLSIPTFLISVLVFYTISSRLKSIAQIKFLHALIAVLGIIKTYKLLPKESLVNPGDNMIYYSLACSLSIVASIIYVRVRY
jgi:hypothetical protein